MHNTTQQKASPYRKAAHALKMKISHPSSQNWLPIHKTKGVQSVLG